MAEPEKKPRTLRGQGEHFADRCVVFSSDERSHQRPLSVVARSRPQAVPSPRAKAGDRQAL